MVAGGSDPEILERCRLNFVEFQRARQRRSGGELVERDGACAWAGTSDFPVFSNGAARGEPWAAPADVIALADEVVGGRGRSYTLFAFDPLERDLLDTARSLGLQPLVDAPQMVCRAPLPAEPPPAGVTVEPVVDDAGWAHVRSLFGEAFAVYGVPAEVNEAFYRRAAAWRAPDTLAVVARLDGRPAACALVFCSHGVAGVNEVSVAPWAQRRGIGAVVTRAVTNLGFEQGARLASLQSSPMGAALYPRLGYVEIARHRGLLRAPAG